MSLKTNKNKIYSFQNDLSESMDRFHTLVGISPNAIFINYDLLRDVLVDLGYYQTTTKDSLMNDLSRIFGLRLYINNGQKNSCWPESYVKIIKRKTNHERNNYQTTRAHTKFTCFL